MKNQAFRTITMVSLFKTFGHHTAADGGRDETDKTDGADFNHPLSGLDLLLTRYLGRCPRLPKCAPAGLSKHSLRQLQNCFIENLKLSQSHFMTFCLCRA